MLENAQQCLSDFQIVGRDPLKKQIFFHAPALDGKPEHFQI